MGHDKVITETETRVGLTLGLPVLFDFNITGVGNVIQVSFKGGE
jgi:hypothetical protein